MYRSNQYTKQTHLVILWLKLQSTSIVQLVNHNRQRYILDQIRINVIKIYTMSRYPNHLTYKGCDFKSRIENLELVYTYQEKKE
jgi:hypothetical protein